MPILHLLPSGSNAVAGLASAVQGLVEAQLQAGLSARSLGCDQLSRLQRGGPVVRHVLRHLSGEPPVIHSHGLWLAASSASRALRQRGLITVVAPHGMLDPWAWQRRRSLKQLLWWIGERRTVQQACCLQALCHAELQAIRTLGITAPVALIPNGIALPDRSPAALEALPPAPWLSHGVPCEARVLLFLGRFHAKKGIEPLLKAWQQLQEAAPAVGDRPWLVLAGFGDDGVLARQLQRQPIHGVLILGPLHGAAKASAYAHARGFVLPSFSEGLPMAALEAMSWGLPCLLSPACNLPEALAAGACWPAPPDAVQLVRVMERWHDACQHHPGMLQHMGMAGRAVVSERFCWSRVAQRTAALYAWLHGGGEAPAWVDLPG